MSPPADMNAAPQLSHGESRKHRELKRMALLWAQAKGFRIAAAKVSILNFRVRADVAADMPHKMPVRAV